MLSTCCQAVLWPCAPMQHLAVGGACTIVGSWRSWRRLTLVSCSDAARQQHCLDQHVLQNALNPKTCHWRAGDIEAGLIRGTEQWQFRGRRIVAAVMDQLLAKQGLASAVDVLITGDSAGGVSALNNANFMLQRVKARLPRWIFSTDILKFLSSFRSAGGVSAAVMLQRSISTSLGPQSASPGCAKWSEVAFPVLGLPACGSAVTDATAVESIRSANFEASRSSLLSICSPRRCRGRADAGWSPWTWV